MYKFIGNHYPNITYTDQKISGNATAQGMRACIYIRQIMTVHATSDTYHFYDV